MKLLKKGDDNQLKDAFKLISSYNVNKRIKKPLLQKIKISKNPQKTNENKMSVVIKKINKNR